MVAVAVPNVGLVVPDTTGSLSANGTVTGPKDFPRAHVVADGRSLAQGARQIARLHLDADVDTRREAPSRVALDLGGAALTAGRTVDQIALRLAGTLAHHEITLTARSPKLQLALAASGIAARISSIVNTEQA